MRLLDLDSEAIKAEIKRNLRYRYFSKRNRSRIAQSLTKAFEKPSESISDDVKPYVVLHKGLKPTRSKPPTSESSEIHQKIRDFNRAVYDNPNDLKAWLELIQIQVLSDNSEPFKPYNFPSLERQIEIVKRAIEKNSGNLRLRLLLTALYEYAMEIVASGSYNTKSTVLVESLKQKDAVAREWYDLVRVCPQHVRVWRGYLAHLRGRFAIFNSNPEAAEQSSAFGRINAVYRRALSTLSGLITGRILSHRTNEDTANQTIGMNM